MSTHQDPDLRTTLHRLADSTTPLPVEDGLWRRGQAARRRGRAFAVAAVLALVVSVGGIATLVTTTDREARTASGGEVPEGAIPHRIEDVPGDLGMTTDLAVGRSSAAFVSASGDVVAVTATDGVPHRLALGGRDPGWVALALSPDGRTLAFQQGSSGGTNVTLLDLESGRRSVLLVHAGDLLKIDTLAWSPRGDWLAWAASAVVDLPAFAGQVRASGTDSRRVAPPANVVSVAVADDGTAALGRVRGGLYLWPPVADLGRPTGIPFGPAAFSPDGTRLALSSAPGSASHTLDVRSGDVLEHPFPTGTLGESVVRPIGWMDDSLQVLLVQELDGSGGELVVATPEAGATGTWRRAVGSVAPEVASSVSLAVDLLPDLDGTSSQELTHDFGPTGSTSSDNPLAATGIELSLLIGLGVAAAIAVLMALRWLWRRLLG
ncbi:MAG TPA: WD40 repeat domain-containing protein [Nocardioides sp.]|nr:WD40 repeat domain-containing protein [Nocardioides sp.]